MRGCFAFRVIIETSVCESSSTISCHLSVLFTSVIPEPVLKMSLGPRKSLVFCICCIIYAQILGNVQITIVKCGATC